MTIIALWLTITSTATVTIIWFGVVLYFFFVVRIVFSLACWANNHG